MRAPVNLITAPRLPLLFPCSLFLAAAEGELHGGGGGSHPGSSFNQDRGNAGKERT